jgi:hypothetical protein
LVFAAVIASRSLQSVFVATAQSLAAEPVSIVVPTVKVLGAA